MIVVMGNEYWQKLASCGGAQDPGHQVLLGCITGELVLSCSLVCGSYSLNVCPFAKSGGF